MSRFGRGTDRAVEWASPHERARARAAQRLDWELDEAESAWLDAHLAECAPCRTTADEYDEIRDRLRAMRAFAPEPPRDLWARTSAAIEREADRSRGRRLVPAGRFPLGALSGVLVVAVVIGATLLSNLPLQAPVAPTDERPLTAETTVPTLRPASTPIIVGAGDVQYVRRDRNGEYGFNVTRVDEVCPDDAETGCPLVEGERETALTFEAEPKSIISSPDQGQAIIVTGTDGTSTSDVYVMALPAEESSSGPTATEPPAETPAPSPTLTGAVPSEVLGSAEPTDPAATPDPSVEPTEDPASPPPSDEPGPSLLATATATATAAGTPAPVAIARDLIVTGETAAYSEDGSWFAFSARPADETQGTDIYVWHVGDESARPVTTDHRSVFASWIDDRLVGSRPDTDLDEGDEAEPRSFLLDPDTGDETALTDAGWRPIVAPSGEYAVTWNGTVVGRNGGRQVGLGTGQLELAAWDGANGPVDPTDATLITPDGSASFDARWDETSSAFAVWVRDASSPQLGRLSLYFVDPESGRLDQPRNAPRDVPALPGFSIGEGRLAWATPPGQGGEGSRVLIVAWTDDGVGRIESAPGDEVLVIR
jgi:hypothetical protein